MFDLFTSWSNRVLFPWYDAANATHVLLMGALGSAVYATTFGVVLWLFVRFWGYAHKIAVDENRKTRRYLRSLEKRARVSAYWQSATSANRIHFVLIRIVPMLALVLTAALCEVSYGLGTAMEASQQSLPKNVVALYNAAKHATEGEQVAFMQQQYIMPMIWMLCFFAISTMFMIVSITVYVLKTARLAELDEPTKLLEAINAIRAALSMPALPDDHPTLRPKPSLLYPD